MGDLKDDIEVFIDKSKKNSKLNKSEIAEVIAIIHALLADDNTNIGYVVNALVELHYAVTAVFFKNVFPALVEQDKTDFIDVFLHTDKILKNAANFGINRNLIIVNALLQAGGNDESLHTVLKFCAKKAYGKDGGQKAGELLSKICFKDTKDKLLLLDYSTWQQSELISFSSWLDIAVVKTSDTAVVAAYNAFLETYNLSKNKRPESEKDMVPNDDGLMAKLNQKGKIDNEKVSKRPKERIIELVMELQSEASKIVNERMKLVKEIEEVKSQLAQVNKNKADLSRQLAEVSSITEQLQIENRLKEQQLCDDEDKITDLNERLRNVFNADKFQQNQELQFLKNDLIKRLKLDYEDFKKLATKEPNLQYYEALVDIIESIFQTLEKRGITLSESYKE